MEKNSKLLTRTFTKLIKTGGLHVRFKLNDDIVMFKCAIFRNRVHFLSLVKICFSEKVTNEKQKKNVFAFF